MKVNTWIVSCLIALTGFSACNKKFEAQKISQQSAVDKSYEKKGQNQLQESCSITQKIIGRSEKEAINMLCDTLSNHSINNFCAEDLRHREFMLNCPGRNWKGSAPVVKSVENSNIVKKDETKKNDDAKPVITKKEELVTTPVVEDTKPVVNDNVNSTPSDIEKIKAELQFLSVSSTKISEDLSALQLQYAQQFQEESESCRTGHLGPWCPSHQIQSVESEYVFHKNDKEETLLVEIRRADSIGMELYVFKSPIDMNSNYVSFELYQLKQERDSKLSIAQSFEQKSNFVKLLEMRLEKVTVDSALKLLTNPKSLRNLLSGATIYKDINVQNNNDTKEVSSTVVKAILEHKALFGTGTKWQDEFELLIIAAANGATNNDQLVLANEMKKSNIPATKQIAAIKIVSINPKSESDITLVWDALKHESAVVRSMAIKALIKTELTSVDKIKILEMLKDVDGEVSFTVLDSVEGMKLDHTHVPTLAQLFELDDKVKRKAILKAMEKINSPESKDFIKTHAEEIKKLDDTLLSTDENDEILD